MPARIKSLKRVHPAKKRPTSSSGGAATPEQRLATIINLLEDRLGVPVFDGPRDGLQVLVLTILSQNTTDLSALKAYIRLCETFPRKGNAKLFRNEKLIPRLPDGAVDPVAIRLSQAADAFFEPDWVRIHTCDEKKLQDVIRPAGLPNSKGPAIQRVLEWVKEQASGYSLEKALAGKSPTEAAEAMSSLKGVGAKTAAVTLIEAMGADLCPVDTHVHRIVNRLGLVSTGDNREKSYRLLKPMIPEGKGYSLHHNLLTFGRTICTAKKPKCSECFLAKVCPSAGKA